MTRAVIIASALLLVGGGLANYLRYSERMPDRGPDFAVVPGSLGDYVGQEKRFSEDSYDILKADTTTLRLYRGADNADYWLFVAYFGSQKYGSQIHSPKHCLPGGGWRIDQLEPYRFSAPDGEKLINRLVIADDHQREIMFYWFETRGGTIRNEFALKWDLMRNSLLLRPTDAAIVRVTSPFLPGESLETATARTLRYLERFDPLITQALPF